MNDVDRLAAQATLLLIFAGIVYLASLYIAGQLAKKRAHAPSPRERRRDERRVIAQLIANLCTDSLKAAVRVENISRGGMCLASIPGGLQRGTVVQADLEAPNTPRPLRAKARAVWISGNRAGFEFMEIDPDLCRWIGAE